MYRKIINIFLLSVLAAGMASCSDWLDENPDNIFTEDQIFSDEVMIKSVLASFYGRSNYGQTLSNSNSYGYLDEACYGGNGGPYQNHEVYFGDIYWRVYEYGLIRNHNQFLRSIRATTILNETQKLAYEAEVRFLRAWTYFCMARSLGGMPIVGDVVFDYDPDTDVTNYQLPRSTEAEIYDYVISECDFAAQHLSDEPSKNTNASRANKWVALSLKARAAIYAASIAKYNDLVTPDIQTPGHEVGIPAELAEHYYQIALNTANEIINSGKYQLYNKDKDLVMNFYKATASKKDNPEVIWARDFIQPDHCHKFTTQNCPSIVSLESAGNNLTPLLNLVEAFEYLDNRDGHLKYADEKGNPIFYDNPEDLFKNKDPRFKATIICNGDEFAGKKITYQAGQYYYQNKKWRTRTGSKGTEDVDGDVLTSINGPIYTTDWSSNKTGFNFRKFMGEDAGTDLNPAIGSEIWYVRFRLAEIELIASEAALELGDKDTALEHLNKIRNRAGLKGLTDMTLLDIEQERRVEFALEDHRWWDLRRWRRAHVVWDGKSENSVHYTLFPYKVKDARRAENGKWVYVRGTSSIFLEARQFLMRTYYCHLDASWLSNNPKLVKNPYQ